MQTDQKTWVEISKKALTSNVRAFRRHLGSGTGFMAVVKSNAYGHGLVETARVVDRAGAAWFAVDNVDEGLILRKNGIKKPILILGYTKKNRLIDCIRHQISFVIYNIETAQTLRRITSRNVQAQVHVKIETGTSRQGVEGEELRALVRMLKTIPGVVIEGASTHYANIEDTTDASYAENQLRRFEEGVALMHHEGVDPPFLHTACSAAAILFPKTHFNLARVGISLYGIWSSKETRVLATERRRSLALTPALTWKSIVAQVKNVKKGTPVSYGLTERVTRDARLAIVPIGYWDGYDRHLSSIGHVLVKGRRCKVMGRVCMNMFVIDVTDVPSVRAEDEVVLLGMQGKEQISADDIASKLGTIPYEIVTRINPQITRIVVN